jgi:peptidoglycan hydrolase-like protein with peptidoglycan-binding domain
MVAATSSTREAPRAQSSSTQPVPDSLKRVLHGHATVKEGDHGADVKAVQRLLRAKGAHIGVDGDFGKHTEAAVRGFQRSHGLEPDGVVGANTLKKLLQKPGSTASDDRVVHVGDRGKDVLAAEKRLTTLGYNSGKVDGRYDQQTARAVRAFKRDEGLKDKSGQHLGKSGKDELQHEVRALDHAPYTARVREKRERTRLDTATRTRANTTGIGVGDDGRLVKNVQAHLNGAGFRAGKVDGHFDGRTEMALKRFQRKSNLEPTGKVDGDTWRALERSRRYADNATSPAQRLGERSAAVKRTERALDKAGFDPGKVDGVFDRNTLQALHKFERKHDMRETDGVGRAQLKAIEKAAKHALVRPVAARLTPISEFGVRDAEGAPANNGARFHAGKDWFAPGGSRVRAPVDGKIVEVRPSSGNSGQVFGGTVKVQGKDGKVWVFRHVDPARVHLGQHVKAGDTLAHVTRWADGPSHTHVELWKTFSGGYDFENMIDPMSVLKRFL